MNLTKARELVRLCETAHPTPVHEGTMPDWCVDIAAHAVVSAWREAYYTGYDAGWKAADDCPYETSADIEGT